MCITFHWMNLPKFIHFLIDGHFVSPPSFVCFAITNNTVWTVLYRNSLCPCAGDSLRSRIPGLYSMQMFTLMVPTFLNAKWYFQIICINFHSHQCSVCWSASSPTLGIIRLPNLFQWSGYSFSLWAWFIFPD